MMMTSAMKLKGDWKGSIFCLTALCLTRPGNVYRHIEFSDLLTYFLRSYLTMDINHTLHAEPLGASKTWSTHPWAQGGEQERTIGKRAGGVGGFFSQTYLVTLVPESRGSQLCDDLIASTCRLVYIRLWRTFVFEFTPTRDRCYDFKNIFAEKFSENIGVFGSNYC
jgi:hypothetical protein